MNRSARIYLAGHTGLVGSALLRGLRAEGYADLITRTHNQLDLERQAEVETFFEREKPEYVFLAAAKVGGIWANLTYLAELIYSNLAIQTNVIHAAWKTGVKRLLFLGSSCVYPRECPQPMKEEYLLTGPLEPTNEPYAVAKIAGIKMCQSYNLQYGTRFLAVMPTNLYGPNDNFDLETSHVLPALIRKFHLAKLASQGSWQSIQEDEETYGKIPNDFLANLVAISTVNGHKDKVPTAYSPLGCGAPEVILWGTGSPRREFLHVDDLAEACTLIMRLPEDKFCSLLSVYATPIMNIGCGEDQTIRELADLVTNVVSFEGKVGWDTDKSDGTPQKLLEISRLTALRWQPRIPLVSGIRQTYTWYQKRSAK